MLDIVNAVNEHPFDDAVTPPTHTLTRSLSFDLLIHLERLTSALYLIDIVSVSSHILDRTCICVFAVDACETEQEANAYLDGLVADAQSFLERPVLASAIFPD